MLNPEDRHEIVTLSRLLHELTQEKLREIFLLLGLPYAEVSGESPGDKIESFLAHLVGEKKIDELKEKLESINPGIFNK